MNKKYVITISCLDETDTTKDYQQYQQTVENLDVRKVIEAVNAEQEDPAVKAWEGVQMKPRAQRSDKGKKRAKHESAPTPAA